MALPLDSSLSLCEPAVRVTTVYVSCVWHEEGLTIVRGEKAQVREQLRSRARLRP